jgi:hypothetical protein
VYEEEPVAPRVAEPMKEFAVTMMMRFQKIMI